MTDDELISRLEETSPEEWTPEELDVLRARARENPAVRAALAQQIWLEQTLVRGLSRRRITADQVLARLDERRRGPLLFGRWLRVAALVLLVGGLAGVWYKLREAPRDQHLADNRRPAQDLPGPTPAGSPKRAPTATGTGAPPTPSATASATPPPVALPSASGTAGPPPVEEPWTAMLAAPAVKFDDFWLAPRRLSRDVETLQRWWTTITGQQRPVNSDERFGMHLGGLFELRAPWQAGATLTLWIADQQQNDQLQLHLWHGAQGLTLELRERPIAQWTAFATTKRPTEPRPATFALAASDNDRARRTGEGPFDLRYADGRVYVSRGDILLLTAPLAGPPDGVYFEGNAVLKGIGLAHVEGMPQCWTGEDLERPNYFDYPTPVAWPALAATERLNELPPGATVIPADDEGLALAAVDTTKPAWSAMALPRDGFYDLVCEVERADVGTGIYLGDEAGRPRYAVGFHEYHPGAPLHLATGRPTETKPRYRYEPKQGPLPAVVFPVRVRLLCGAGNIKVFVSTDGRSWGRIMDPIRGTDGAPATLGVFCAPGKGKRSIDVTRVRHEVRFAVDQERLAATQPLPENGGYGQWLVDAVRPVDPDANDDAEFDTAGDLRRLQEQAAALLVRGVRDDTARSLVAGLTISPYAADDADRERPLYDFSTLCLIADAFDGGAALEWYDHFLQYGAQHSGEWAHVKLAQQAELARLRWMEMPLSTAARLPFMPPELIRDAIFGLIHVGKWDELDRLCRVWHFFGGKLDPNARRQPRREDVMELVDWAAAQAERRRTTPEGQLPAAPQFVFKPEWRHPLIEQFGKEGYNVLAELETALQEKAYPDACRIITGVTAAQAVGLLPNAADADLLVSLPGAVALAMRTHPELRAAMQRDYGDLAQLRFRQASAEGDVDAVEALTTQFYGTTAAAEAQMWLGDRALAQGDAPRAEGHYQAARTELPEGADPGGVLARLRLAAAMQGRDSGQAPQTAVRLGEWNLSPAEFERTVQELRSHAPEMETGPRSASGAAVNQITSPIPPPSRMTLKPFAKVDGDLGRNPEQNPERESDLIGPQLATTFSGERMIVTNRFQTLAFELADGKLAWRTSLGGEQGRTYQWPKVAMPPVVVDGRIFVRRLTAAGPELACLDETSGRVLWRSPRGEIVASDPLVAGDRVQAVVLAVPQQDTLEAVLTTFELRTGKVLSRRPMVMLRDYWKRELNCKLTPAGDVLLMQLAGCIIGCSPEGDLRWLRRLPWLPASLAKWSKSINSQTWEELTEGNLTVEGALHDQFKIDIRTGAIQLHNRSWYGVGRDPDAGEPRDRYAPFRRLAHGNDMFGVYEQRLNRKLFRPEIIWSSETDGEARAAWPTPWQKTRGSVGPLASHEGRYFAVTTGDLKSPARDIVELISQKPLESEAPDLLGSRIPPQWLGSTPEPIRTLDPVGETWQLVQSRYDEKVWLENRLFLEDDCRLTLAGTDAPAIWNRTVALPTASPKVLKLRTAAAGTEPWNLKVRINGETVSERKIEPAAGGDSPWRDDVVDLARYAGRTIQITLLHEAGPPAKGAKPSPAAWQSMTIVEK